MHGEVVLTQPMSTRLLVLLLFTILIGVAIWLAAGTYARTESVRGILVTDVPSAKVVAPAAGIVTALNVKEGTLVAKGGHLGTVDADRRDENGSQIGVESLATVDERLALAGSQLALTATRQRNERDRLNTIVRSADQKLAELGSQITIQQDIVASNQQLFDQLAPVVAKGFVSRVQYEGRRQTLLNSQQQLGSLRQQRLTIQGDKASAEAQLASLDEDTAWTVNEIESSAQALSQQRAELRGAKTYALVAPIAGQVTALQISAGSTARTDIPLMVIVPEKSTLRAEIYAPSRAIGFVRPGQEVRLLYDAFPYQRFGSFPGRIASVSRTVIDPQDLQVPFQIEEPVYRVTVALERQFVPAYGDRAPLQPGMTLTGNLILERQSFLSWLLSPLQAVWNRT